MLTTRLFWKIYATYALVILVTTVLVGGLVASSVYRDAQVSITRDLRDRTVLLRDITLPLLAEGDADRLQIQVAGLGRETATRYTVIAADGRVLADSERDPATMDDHRTRPEVLEARSRGEGTAKRFSQTTRDTRLYLARPVYREGTLVGYVRGSLSLQKIDEQLDRLTDRVLLGAVLASVIALVLGFFAARRIVVPLLGLNRATEAVSRGDYRRRVPVTSRDELGELARGFNTMASDAQERLDAVTEERNKLAAVLGGMVEGVIAVDADERIVHINRAAASILGAGTKPLHGRHVWELAHALDVARILTDSLREELVLTGKARLLEPGGERVLELFASPLRDGEGRITGSVVVLHDVTRLRRLEEVRRDFVANASHELKTPIAAILGLVETLLDDGDGVPPEMRTRFLERIRHQSQRLSALVQDLIALSRLESRDREEDREAVDVSRVAADAFHSLAPAAEAKRLDYRIETPDEEVRILASERDLREAVENLLDNAVKYTPEEGRVVLRVSRDDGEAVLTVEDDGIGIPPELHDRVFERFFRVDQARSREVGGTGLGLAIVRNVAQSLGGTVSLDSAPGSGSRFTLRFPAVTEARLGS